jgi:hypothetical protein
MASKGPSFSSYDEVEEEMAKQRRGELQKPHYMEKKLADLTKAAKAKPTI